MANKRFEAIDLNIGENYLENWKVYQAIRELIANALDEQEDGNIQIIEKAENTYIIKDFGCGLKPDDFIMKGSKKFNDKTKIGSFGFGLKDALGVLNSNNIDVEIITSEFKYKFNMKEKSEKIKSKTLHAYIYENNSKKKFKGTEVILKKCEKEHIEKAKNEFLKFKADKINVLEENEFGEVLEKEDKSCAYIYVNGMKISEDKKLGFSYNIKSISSVLQEALNRERKDIRRGAYRKDITKILENADWNNVFGTNSNTLFDILEKQLNETEDNFDEISWKDILNKTIDYVENKYKDDYDKIIFMENNKSKTNIEIFDLEDCKEKIKLIIVSGKIKDKVIEKLKSMKSNKIINVLEKVKKPTKIKGDETSIKEINLISNKEAIEQKIEKIRNLFNWSKLEMLKELEYMTLKLKYPND